MDEVFNGIVVESMKIHEVAGVALKNDASNSPRHGSSLSCSVEQFCMTRIYFSIYYADVQLRQEVSDRLVVVEARLNAKRDLRVQIELTLPLAADPARAGCQTLRHQLEGPEPQSTTDRSPISTPRRCNRSLYEVSYI